MQKQIFRKKKKEKKDINKIKAVLVLNGNCISNTYVNLLKLHIKYLRTKFKVPSIILTSFRQKLILPLPPQNEPQKSELRVRLSMNLY